MTSALIDTAATTTTASQQVTFIQNAVPPLVDGLYTLSVTQSIPNQTPGSFPASATFVVQGERFTIQPTEIDSVFPPNLANGEFDGTFAHVVFNRRTLPWEREIDTPGSQNRYPDSPWLAVLVCDDATAPKPQSVTAADLVQANQPITVFDDKSVTGTGTLVTTTLSYGTAVLGELEYGQAPTDPCTAIDLPIALFNRIAPAAADMQYLAHIREVDTADGPDSANTSQQNAVVLGNRVPTTTNGAARAFLVSLEGMADYLPNADGSQSTAVGATITAVRLIVFQTWSFTANTMDQALEQLLEGLNAPVNGTQVTTLTLPISGTAPTSTQVAAAMANQASGALASGDAAVLVQNALLMGYVPMNHHLRHGGDTVSFYRGPLVPFAVPSTTPSYYTGPDAANGYNPYTGMFDVSYGAAWQLGQWLMLQSAGIANQLYQWKCSVTAQQAVAAEQAILAGRLGARKDLLSSIVGKQFTASTTSPQIPGEVTTWFQNLASLQGVPFNYLVPDERMLPPESLRFFYVDANWIDALIDGAFSIGRNVTSSTSIESLHAPRLRAMARNAAPRAANRKLERAITASRARATPLADAGGAGAAVGAIPANGMMSAGGPAPTESAVAANGATSASGPITGFLLRSQAVSGWPNLRAVGFSDTGATTQIPLLRSVQLSSDTMICFFEGVLAALYLREPPEQMHLGLEMQAGSYGIELRSVSGGPGATRPGQQYTASGGWAKVSMRADNATLVVASTASAIQNTLQTQFSQSFPQGFTSAEFALEFTKGVVEVEYQS